MDHEDTPDPGSAKSGLHDDALRDKNFFLIHLCNYPLKAALFVAFLTCFLLYSLL